MPAHASPSGFSALATFQFHSFVDSLSDL